MPETLDKDQINRLWEHRHHLDICYNNQMNFFLIFESVLLGVVGVIYTRPSLAPFVLKAIVLLGLSLTIVWGYIQVYHKYVLNDLTSLVKELVPEYRLMAKRRARVRWFVSDLWLVTYAVPTLVGLVWIALLFYL